MIKSILVICFLINTLITYSQDSSLVYNSKRAIKLEGTSNFRDLGGYPAANGKTVKWGKLYRSADVSKLTENDLKSVETLQLGTVCDLRGPDELKNSPDKLPAGVNYINLPAGSEEVRSSASYAAMNRDSIMMNAFYSRTDHLRSKYKPMFDELLALPDNKALMFHCTAGKDRTGIGAAIILSALGVDKKYIVADYVATNIFWDNKKMIDMLIKSGMKEVNVKAIMDANPIYINIFFETIQKKYGSMDNFLINELELNKSKINDLRKLYLTKSS